MDKKSALACVIYAKHRIVSVLITARVRSTTGR